MGNVNLSDCAEFWALPKCTWINKEAYLRPPHGTSGKDALLYLITLVPDKMHTKEKNTDNS